MTFIFHPEAEAEFIAVIDYYEDQEVGLGYVFSAEVFAGIQSIVKYPEAWPVNTSVNPARSAGVALFAGGWAISQLWLFWIAPIVGGILGALVHSLIGSTKE